VKQRRESRRESVEDDQPLQIYFSMAETDVILVETMEKADTNALLLNVNENAFSKYFSYYLCEYNSLNYIAL